MTIRVTIWNEYRHEKEDDDVIKIYPDGMHAPIADYLRKQGLEVRIATLDDPNNGITDEILANTDVLTWWGHKAHGAVADEVAEKVQKAVLGGMGFLPMHSAHISKPFLKLMGTSGSLRWRSDGEKERIWVVEPGHPIAEGLGEYFELPAVEMYGERFDVPTPDNLVFISWFQGGEVFRSGCTWHRGNGKIFYFRPGDQEYPIYYDENVLKVLYNGIKWLAPVTRQQPEVTHITEFMD